MFSGAVADTLLSEMFKDGRVARDPDRYQETARKKLVSIGNIDEYTFIRLATDVCDSAVSPRELRSQAISASLTVYAMSEIETFRPLRGRPYSLARGDVEANIAELAAGEPPDDDVSFQIWKCKTRNYVSDEDLYEGVRLMGEVECTTRLVEQGHGQTATQHKSHPRMGSKCTTSSTWVHGLGQLLAESDRNKDEKDLAKMKTQLEKLKRKVPERLHAENIYYADLRAALNRKDGTNAIVRAHCRTSRKVMKELTSKFDDLDEETQLWYHAESKKQASESRSNIEEAINTLEADIQAKREVIERSRADRSACMYVSNCTFDDKEVLALAKLWKSKDDRYKICQVNQRRMESLRQPEVPSDFVKAQLTAMTWKGKDAKTILPDSIKRWATPFSRARKYFELTCLIVGSGEDCKYYGFRYATQNPINVVFLELYLVEDDELLTDFSTAAMLEFEVKQHEYNFNVLPLHVVSASELDIDEGTRMRILPGLVYGKGLVAWCDEDAIQFDIFLAGLPIDFTKPPKEKPEEPDIEVPPPADYWESCPWMEHRRARNKKKPDSDSGDDSSTDSSVDQDGDPEDDDADIEDATAYVRLLRKEWLLEHHEEEIDFEVVPRGGDSTLRDHGVMCDSWRGQGKRAYHERWVAAYFQYRSCTNAILEHGEEIAQLLCRQWCHKMQYYYNRWKRRYTVEFGDIYDDEYILAYRPLDECVELFDRLAIGTPSFARARFIDDLIPVWIAP